MLDIEHADFQINQNIIEYRESTIEHPVSAAIQFYY